MRFNSLRVEQGVDHLISPLDGAMPVNLKEMNLKQLKALTSILTDLSKVKKGLDDRSLKFLGRGKDGQKLPSLGALLGTLKNLFRVRIKSRFLCEDEKEICSYIPIKKF